MLENNEAMVGVNTDYGIATILGNFSDEAIQDIIQESIDKYRFRPFGLRAPNYPKIINDRFDSILINSTGYDDTIQEKRAETLTTIIDTILTYYELVRSDDIPDDQLFTVCYLVYQLFVSEFTPRMINFYTQYIINNMDNFLKILNPEDKSVKNTYTKRIYNNQDYAIIYENMSKIVDILAGLDIPLDQLITYISDENTSNFLCQYIQDTGDVYKNKFASFLVDEATSSDIIVKIRLQFVGVTSENIDVPILTQNQITKNK